MGKIRKTGLKRVGNRFLDLIKIGIAWNGYPDFARIIFFHCGPQRRLTLYTMRLSAARDRVQEAAGVQEEQREASGVFASNPLELMQVLCEKKVGKHTTIAIPVGLPVRRYEYLAI